MKNLKHIQKTNAKPQLNENAKDQNKDARAYLFQRYEEFELAYIELFERIRKGLDNLELKKLGISLRSENNEPTIPHNEPGKTGSF